MPSRFDSYKENIWSNLPEIKYFNIKITYICLMIVVEKRIFSLRLVTVKSR